MHIYTRHGYVMSVQPFSQPD